MSATKRYRLLCLFTIGLLLSGMSCSRNRPDIEANKEEATPVNPEPNRLDKRIADATAVIEKNPTEFDSRGESGYYKRGMAYAEKGEDDQAIADLTEAIRLYPAAMTANQRARCLETYDTRARVYVKTKELNKAIADYTKVIEIGTGGFFPGLAANAHYKRGVLYDDKGEHEKASADYKDAARLAPEMLTTNPDLKKRLGEKKP